MEKIYSIYIRTVGDKKVESVSVNVGLVKDLTLVEGAAKEFLRLHMDDISPHPYNAASVPPLQSSIVHSTENGMSYEFPVAANFWNEKDGHYKPEVFYLGVTPIGILTNMNEVKNSITGLGN